MKIEAKKQFDIEDPYDWLHRRLNLLMKIKDVLDVGDVYYDVGEWTPLKCIFLSYFTGMYLRIIDEQLRKQFKNLKVYYIDLFAGPGINRINDIKMFGSPIISIDSATASGATPFDKMFFVDWKHKNSKALEERLEYLSEISEYSWIKEKYEIIMGDANDAIKKIADEIEESKPYHFLAFIDPYGMELRWENFEYLLKLEYGDIIYNYQTQQIGRYWGNVKGGVGDQSIIEKFDEFFGTDDWKRANNRDNLKSIYISQIKQYRTFVEEIKIGSENFIYHLLVAFRKTSGGSPWKSSIQRAKDLIEILGGEAVRFSLDYLSGKVKRLDDYLPQKRDESKVQRKLHEFIN